MAHTQDGDRQEHGRELQGPEELLIGRHAAEESLRRLREPEDGAEVDEEAGGGDGEDEGVFAPDVFVVAMDGEGDAEEQQDEQERREGECLHREAREQDVVARVWVFAVGLGRADDGGAGDLHDGRQDVRRDEAPQYQLPGQPPLPLLLRIPIIISSCCSIDSDRSGPRDEAVDREVDSRGDEDGRHDDEEVLHHEPDDVIGIISGRQRAEHIADCFEQAGECDE